VSESAAECFSLRKGLEKWIEEQEARSLNSLEPEPQFGKLRRIRG
jgi:hypothetical protein